MREGRVGRLRFSGFVNGPHPELVDGSFNETGHFADRGFTLRPCADLPLLELLVALLDDVAGNGAAAIELGFVPFQLGPVGVEVDHLEERFDQYCLKILALFSKFFILKKYWLEFCFFYNFLKISNNWIFYSKIKILTLNSILKHCNY